MTRWLIYLAVIYAVFHLLRSSKRLVASTAVRTQPSKPSPYETLGIDPGASEEEIRQAYQQKVRHFHPDRVANAADELQQLAEERTKQLNKAYQELMDKR